MKVVLLAGGQGTRLSEVTSSIPKPMVKIGKIPILLHIIKSYSFFGHEDFYIATGYKSELINKYFKSISLNYKKINENHTFLNLKYYKNIKINLINTGINTMTGGRILRLKKYIKDENFLMTYGDGLSNINIKKLINLHLKKNKIATLTAVRPPARFGELKLLKNSVISFNEKPQVQLGWINGGFFVLNKKIFNYITDNKTIFEKKPLEVLSNINQLNAYKHYDFWQCMDTKRDYLYLKKLYYSNKKYWEIYKN